MISQQNWSVGRGVYRDCTPDKIHSSLSSFFAHTVTGPYDQDISCLMVGKKGTGKSSACLSIGYHTAIKIAEIIGGKWSDYFDIDHVAIVDPLRAIELLSKSVQYGVYIYDDIGLGWNARNYASDENKDKNDIFQINRVDNTVQFMSVPNQFLLDKVPRSLVSHYAEMDQQFYHKGYTTLKFFEPQTLFRAGKLIQPYLVVDKSKFILYRIPAPPHELWQVYKKERRRISDEIKKSRGERMMGNYDTTQGSVSGKRSKYWGEMKEKYQKEIKELLGTGKSYYVVARELGITPTAVNKIASM